MLVIGRSYQNKVFAAEVEINPTQFVASRSIKLGCSGGGKAQGSANVVMKNYQTPLVLTSSVDDPTPLGPESPGGWWPSVTNLEQRHVAKTP